MPPPSWIYLPQAAHISGYFIYCWAIYLGSIVKFNASYEYCGVFSVASVRVWGGDGCGRRYQGGKYEGIFPVNFLGTPNTVFYLRQ